jgi:preprotein translocase subunit SecF
VGPTIIRLIAGSSYTRVSGRKGRDTSVEQTLAIIIFAAALASSIALILAIKEEGERSFSVAYFVGLWAT